MVFVFLLIAHWIGDFLLQTTNMALKKSSSLKWLLLHVAVYTLTLFAFAVFTFSWQIALGYTIVNGVLHLIIDFFASKLASRFLEKPRIFYPIIGFDQLLHLSCLYYTFLNADLLAL